MTVKNLEDMLYAFYAVPNLGPDGMAHRAKLAVTYHRMTGSYFAARFYTNGSRD